MNLQIHFRFLWSYYRVDSRIKDVVLGVCEGTLPWHDDDIKWKHFPRYCPFVRGIHRSPVNSPHKGQWRGALMFSLNCVWINSWINNRKAGDLRRGRAHYDVIVMLAEWFWIILLTYGGIQIAWIYLYSLPKTNMWMGNCTSWFWYVIIHSNPNWNGGWGYDMAWCNSFTIKWAKLRYD